MYNGAGMQGPNYGQMGMQGGSFPNQGPSAGYDGMQGMSNAPYAQTMPPQIPPPMSQMGSGPFQTQFQTQLPMSMGGPPQQAPPQPMSDGFQSNQGMGTGGAFNSSTGFLGTSPVDEQMQQTEKELAELTAQINQLQKAQVPGTQQFDSTSGNMAGVYDDSDSDSDNDWWHLPAPASAPGATMSGFTMGAPCATPMGQPFPSNDGMGCGASPMPYGMPQSGMSAGMGPCPSAGHFPAAMNGQMVGGAPGWG